MASEGGDDLSWLSLSNYAGKGVDISSSGKRKRHRGKLHENGKKIKKTARSRKNPYIPALEYAKESIVTTLVDRMPESTSAFILDAKGSQENIVLGAPLHVPRYETFSLEKWYPEMDRYSFLIRNKASDTHDVIGGSIRRSGSKGTKTSRDYRKERENLLNGRYFSKDHEDTLQEKRICFTGAVSNVSGGTEFIPLGRSMTGTFEYISMEDRIMQMTKEFNMRLRENPLNVSLWIEYAGFQDVISKSSDIANRKKAEILKKACRHNPGNDKLLMKYLRSLKKLQGEDVADMWMRALCVNPGSTLLWREYVIFREGYYPQYRFEDIYETYCVAISTINNLKLELEEKGKLFQLFNAFSCVSGLTPLPTHDYSLIALIEGVELPAKHKEMEKTLLWLLARMCRHNSVAGFGKRNTELLLALVEFNHYCPEKLHSMSFDHKTDFYKSFWCSGEKRLGDRGATRWDNWFSGKVVPNMKEFVTEKEKDNLDTSITEFLAEFNTSSNIFRGFNEEEVATHSLGSSSVCQVKMDDPVELVTGPNERNPNDVVLFSDIEDCLFFLLDPSMKFELIYILINFMLPGSSYDTQAEDYAIHCGGIRQSTNHTLRLPLISQDGDVTAGAALSTLNLLTNSLEDYRNSINDVDKVKVVELFQHSLDDETKLFFLRYLAAPGYFEFVTNTFQQLLERYPQSDGLSIEYLLFLRRCESADAQIPPGRGFMDIAKGLMHQNRSSLAILNCVAFSSESKLDSKISGVVHRSIEASSQIDSPVHYSMPMLCYSHAISLIREGASRQQLLSLLSSSVWGKGKESGAANESSVEAILAKIERKFAFLTRRLKNDESLLHFHSSQYFSWFTGCYALYLEILGNFKGAENVFLKAEDILSNTKAKAKLKKAHGLSRYETLLNGATIPSSDRDDVIAAEEDGDKDEEGEDITEESRDLKLESLESHIHDSFLRIGQESGEVDAADAALELIFHLHINCARRVDDNVQLRRTIMIAISNFPMSTTFHSMYMSTGEIGYMNPYKRINTADLAMFDGSLAQFFDIITGILRNEVLGQDNNRAIHSIEKALHVAGNWARSIWKLWIGYLANAGQETQLKKAYLRATHQLPADKDIWMMYRICTYELRDVQEMIDAKGVNIKEKEEELKKYR